MAVEGRADYEERVARISILAGSLAPGPDTLKQTGGQDPEISCGRGGPYVDNPPQHGAQDARLFGAAAGLPAAGPAGSPRLAAFTAAIDRILDDDRSAPPKQRHTAKRIHERLRAENGFAGGYTTVKDYVRERRAEVREVFVPLEHPPGHAQADFGEAVAVVGGVERKIPFFLPRPAALGRRLRQGLPGGANLSGKARSGPCRGHPSYR